jgi:CRP-like cAMP-binding protein
MSIAGIFPIKNWDFDSESILMDLPADELTALTAHQSIHNYDKGEVIFREGAFPSGIFYISKGMAKKFKVDKEGREQIIYVAGPGELIGYHAILSEDRYPDSAAALEKSKIIFIPKEDFLRVLAKSNVLSKRLLKTLSHEFAVLINGLTLVAKRSVKERLALQLIVMREKYKVNNHSANIVEINLSRDDLANLVGTTKENVVRILTEFENEGILKRKGRKIIVQKVKHLVEISNYK